jgi:branched-chain amino acid transport system substrate-binding protein
MMGGAMIGMLVTPIKMQLGPIANGLVTAEYFPAALAKQIAGARDFLTRYGERAVAARVDPLGFACGPFAYSAGQVLARAVTETKSLDHDKLAEYCTASVASKPFRVTFVRAGRRMVEDAHALDTDSERAT